MKVGGGTDIVDRSDLMLQVAKGNLLAANTDYICHQVNCMNVMGAGVAKAIYSKWPEVKTEYHKFCNGVAEPKALLGQFQIVPLRGESRSVINIFGQLNYGRRPGTVYTDYGALQTAFTGINSLCASQTIAFPYGFGCGLAGGDWIVVEKLMLEHLCDCHVTVYMKE